MTRIRSGEYGYLVALFALVVIAAWPFLSRSGLPLETDAELHVFRLAELARLVGAGELYPRWAPHFYFGYGYPIFNYYAPLAYYLGLPIALAPGAGAVLATKFVFVFTFFAGALGIYGFVGDWWGRGAALVAAAAYIFAPYVHYVDPHARGDLAEFLSFGLFPLALWAFSRLLRFGSAGSFLGAVLATALVILSHNLMALVFFAVLSAWVVWQIAIRIRTDRRLGLVVSGLSYWFETRGLSMLLALALGVGVAAFFWLPVALEQDAVNLTSLIGDGGHFDFRNHFLGVDELLGPTKLLDWGATEPEFALNLGMAQWLLAVLGVGGLATGYARHRAHTLFFALAAIVFIFLMTNSSVDVWRAIPMMPYLQFPWRFLGPAAAMLAVLSGVAVQSLSSCLAEQVQRESNDADNGSAHEFYKGRRVAFSLQQWFPVLFILVLLLQALPLTMVPPWSELAWDTSARAVMVIERQGRWLGTTSTADFVPRTVEVLPRPQAAMVDQFIAGGELDRVNRATLPQGAYVESERITPLHSRYHVSAERPFLLRLFLFAFPGWEAQIDGVTVDTTLGRPEGFVVVPVPAGEHVVDVDFLETTERRIAWLLSAAATVMSIAFTILLVRHSGVIDRPAAESGKLRRCVRATTRLTPVPVVTVGILLLLVFALTQRQELLHHRSQGWNAIPADHDIFADLDKQVALIGYDVPAQVEPGKQLEVTLYWKAQQEMDLNYQVFLHLLDPSDIPVAQSDKLNPGDFPTARWPTDKYVRDNHRLQLPEGITPGIYTLSAGLWLQNEGRRLPLISPSGDVIGDSIYFAEIEVR